MAESPEECGWQVGKCLTQCLEHVLQNEVLTDVKFIISSTSAENKNVTLSAHKLLLCIRSPVFEAMFSGNFSESNNEVLIEDSEPEPFRQMLRYIYTDDVHLTGETVVQIQYLAKKYILEGLVTKCTDYLKTNLCPENVCDILTHSIHFNEETLTERCLNICASDTAGAVKSEAFYRMPQDVLLTFLKGDLQYEQEEAVLTACIEWAERRRKLEVEKRYLRDILGDCLYQIRFCQLTPERLAAVVGNSSVLCERDMNLFLLKNLTKDSSYGKMISDLGYNIYSRKLTFERPGSLVGQPSVTGNTEVIRFSVNETFSFFGVGVYGGRPGLQHEVHIELRDIAANTDLAKIESTFKSDENSMVSLAFNQKITLSPNKQYTLQATLPNDTCCLFARSDPPQLNDRTTRRFTLTLYPDTSPYFSAQRYLGYIKELHMYNMTE